MCGMWPSAADRRDYLKSVHRAGRAAAASLAQNLDAFVSRAALLTHRRRYGLKVMQLTLRWRTMRRRCSSARVTRSAALAHVPPLQTLMRCSLRLSHTHDPRVAVEVVWRTSSPSLGWRHHRQLRCLHRMVTEYLGEVREGLSAPLVSAVMPVPVQASKVAASAVAMGACRMTSTEVPLAMAAICSTCSTVSRRLLRCPGTTPTTAAPQALTVSATTVTTRPLQTTAATAAVIRAVTVSVAVAVIVAMETAVVMACRGRIAPRRSVWRTRMWRPSVQMMFWMAS
jgi:hypothetical protein